MEVTAGRRGTPSACSRRACQLAYVGARKPPAPTQGGVTLGPRQSYLNMATTSPTCVDAWDESLHYEPTAGLVVNGRWRRYGRFVTLAASALAAIVIPSSQGGPALLRCWPGGADWAVHDAGAFWRSGIVELVGQGPSGAARPDATNSPEQIAAAATGDRLAARRAIRSSTGQVLGVLCAADSRPTIWTKTTCDMLQQFASAAAADLELRHALAEHEANEQWMAIPRVNDALTGLAIGIAARPACVPLFLALRLRAAAYRRASSDWPTRRPKTSSLFLPGRRRFSRGEQPVRTPRRRSAACINRSTGYSRTAGTERLCPTWRDELRCSSSMSTERMRRRRSATAACGLSGTHEVGKEDLRSR